jgi:hypothetical protein
MPVTYANRRATWVFFIETHHHTFFVLSTFEFFDRTRLQADDAKERWLAARGPNLRAEHGVIAAVDGGTRELVRKSGFAVNPVARKVWFAIPTFSRFLWHPRRPRHQGIPSAGTNRSARLGNFGQCATAALADMAVTVIWNLQLAGPIEASRVRIPLSPP